MTATDLVAVRLLLPRFDPGIHRALAAAEIDVFRVPALTTDAVHVCLELEAANEAEARGRIRNALDAEFVVLSEDDFGLGALLSNVPRWGDGEPLPALEDGADLFRA